MFVAPALGENAVNFTSAQYNTCRRIPSRWQSVFNRDGKPDQRGEPYAANSVVSYVDVTWRGAPA